MIIKTHAYPRAGLFGNPSDGYFGKTIAFVFRNYRADVVLYQTPELEILPNERDHSRFGSVGKLVEDVNLHGYYGGIRLLKATVKKFCDYCSHSQIILDNRNFTIRYKSNIPHRVGLAGSSAIITAGLRALTAFYQVTIPLPIQANLVLAVEKEELGISAGLQDRVAQTFEGLVAMNFARELFKRQGYGHYEKLDSRLLPPLYLAYRTDLAEGSEIFHNNIRERFEQGEQKVVKAMTFWAGLSDQFRIALRRGDRKKISALIDANFDKRCELYRISDDNLKMVDAARSAGASAKFTGSGGAIIGTYSDETMLRKLEKKLGSLNVKVIKPLLPRA